jgi:transglutaminase-like putative cysteine protease
MPLTIAALIALSGLTLIRIYNGPLLAALVAGAAAGSVLISTLLRRAPAWLVAPSSVAGLVAYAIFTVSTSARAAGFDEDLSRLATDAARNAIPRLLTALIPVEAQPDTVLGPIVLAWLAGLAGAELAGRARRPALALVPPALLYVGALVLVGPNAGVVLWQPLAFAGVAAIGLAAASAGPGIGELTGLPARARTALRARTAAGLGAGLVAVLALIALAAPLAARVVDRAPSDPRRYVAPPSLDVLDQNPLIRVSGWAANPDQHLFDVTVDGQRPQPTTPAATGPASPSPGESEQPVAEESTPPEVTPPADTRDTRLRLAVLADWDGVTWHIDADYRSAGRVLPAAFAPAAGGEVAPRTIRERITIAELDGRLLPAVSTPRRIDGVRVAYDQATGTVLRTERLEPGLAYTVTSVNPGIDVNLLPAADVPSGKDVARYLAVGDAVPADLSQLAEQVAAGEGSPYLRALALELFLSEHFRYAADAPSGHAYPNLRFFLFGDPRAGGQRGTSEQFATSFATLGRLLGLPTRVVVGFRTPAGGGPITGADALAWPEVLFAGVGWVPFDPMPDPQTPPRPLEDEFLPKPVPPTTPPVTVEPPPEPTYAATSPAPGPVAAARRGPGAGIVAGGAGGGLVVLILLFLLTVVVLRAAQRRRRLDRGSPRQRVLGAWAEVLDALTLAGSPPPAHLAASEVAEHAAAVGRTAPGRSHGRRPRRAVPPLDDLASMVNAVGFAGDAIGAPPVGTDEAAAAARAGAVGYAAALRARRGWWRRLLWTVDPRPLRRRRGV